MSDLRCPSCGYVHHGAQDEDARIWRDEGCFNGCATEPEKIEPEQSSPGQAG